MCASTGKVEGGVGGGAGRALLESGQQSGGGPSLLTGKQEHELSLWAKTEGESLHLLRGVRAWVFLGPPWVQQSKPERSCGAPLLHPGEKGRKTKKKSSSSRKSYLVSLTLLRMKG